MDKNRLRSANLTGASWSKSSYSAGGNGDCVEVTRVTEGGDLLGMAVRDSKNPEGGVLRFTPSEWRAFAQGVENGEFKI